MKRLPSLISVLLLVGSAVGTVCAAPLTPGNLVVVRVGDGTAALGSAATAVFLDEYTPAGAPVQTIPMPIVAAGPNRALTNSGTATSEAFLTVSTNNQYLVLAGYDAVPGTAGVAASVTATINRIVGRVSMAGAVDTSTFYNGLTYSGSNIRSAASDDGTRFWTGGTASTASNGGCWLVPLGTTSAPVQISATGAGTLTNMRVVNIFGGQLYTSSASGTFQGVSTIGAGLPTISGQTVTLLPGFPVAAGPSSYDYFFANTTTLYVADDRAISSGGGVQKWIFGGATWTLAYTLNAGLPPTLGCRGLTGVVNGSTVTLHATSASGTNNNAMVTVTDSGPSSPFTALASAGTNQVFRGIRRVPSVVTPPPAVTLAVDQVTYAGSITGDVPNSEYGHMTIGYVPSPSGGGQFLNVVATTGGPTDWIVQNLLLPGVVIVDTAPTAVTTTIDLTNLGVARGVSALGLPVTFDMELSNTPVTSPPALDTPLNLNVGTTVSQQGGYETELAVNRGLAEVPALTKPVFVPGPLRFARRTGLPNPDVGQDQCSPCSVAQSMHWLAQQYPNDINLGNKTIYDTIAKLKVDMNWVAPTCFQGGGTSAAGIIQGKLAFFQRNDPGQFFRQGWRVKYAGNQPAAFLQGRMAARRAGAAGPPTFDFLLSELEAGEDVEIHIGFFQDVGGGNFRRNGGHSMAVLGAIQFGNKQMLVTRDDGAQDPAFDANCQPLAKPDNTHPAVVDGKRPLNVSQVLIGGPAAGPLNGYMYLTGEKRRNRVELITSESPPNANATAVTDTVISNGGVTFSASLWTKDGVPIGRTFPDGVTPAPGVPQSETYTLPDVPNDWHWSATVTRPGGALTFNFDGAFTTPASIIVPLANLPSTPVLSLVADLNANTYVLSDINGPVATGSWSGYPGNLPPSIVPTGDVRRNSPPPPPCPGDLNGDRQVDINDLALLLAHFGQAGTNVIGDFDHNGFVDINDLAFLLAHFGLVCP